MSKIRVLVVEDSLTVRKRIVEVLSAAPDLEVVGEAEDGKRGIELCQELRPDVITLDLVLPIMSGLAATEYIMAYCPTPIVIVSGSQNRGQLLKGYEALAAGAVDVVEKPKGEEADGEWERHLVFTVRIAARVKVITHPRMRIAARRAPPLPAPPLPVARVRLIALGASTGGPAALSEILGALPDDFPVPILLVLHIGEILGGSFADWLDGQTALGVRVAVDGEPLPERGVRMAPPGRHLVYQRGRLRLTTEAERHSCRPSVDVLFESLAQSFSTDLVACLLTGMGKDGAEGLAAIRRAGGYTIAQDEATSVVYGMPREAQRLGAAREVLALPQIAPALLALAAPELRGRS
jgi:two-component system chemotaxis response regulator CheB